MPIIELNGIKINYRDEGEGDPLVLIHNLTSNIKGFDRNIPEFARRYRTVAADLRGHGETTHEEDPVRAVDFYTFDKLVDDQLALLDHLGIERFHLFGQAYWGANTALHLFHRVPDRVRSVALSSTSMIISDAERKPYDVLGKEGRDNFLRMHRIARTEGMMGVYNDRLTSGQFWGPKVISSPEILSAFIEAHERTSPTAFVTIPALTADRRNDIAATLRETTVPLMLLLGEDEKLTNRAFFIEEMRADYPATHVMIIPDAGHYPTIENPYDFNRALIDFFAGVERDVRVLG